MTIILAIPQIRFHAYLDATGRGALEQKVSNLELIGKHGGGRTVSVALIFRGMRTARRE
jgi:hypothetical protein